MSISQSVSSMLDKYGADVEIRTEGETVNSKAFIEPLRYKNKIYIGGKYHRIGKSERYIYIGKPNYPLIANETIIKSQDKEYMVKRCEYYRQDDLIFYVWAIVDLIGAEDDFE